MEAGIDRVVCLAANDAFVMYQWVKSRGIAKGSLGAWDGHAQLALRHGRQRRAVKKLLPEPNLRDNPEGIAVPVSDAETMLAYLQGSTR